MLVFSISRRTLLKTVEKREILKVVFYRVRACLVGYEISDRTHRTLEDFSQEKQNVSGSVWRSYGEAYLQPGIFKGVYSYLRVRVQISCRAHRNLGYRHGGRPELTEVSGTDHTRVRTPATQKPEPTEYRDHEFSSGYFLKFLALLWSQHMTTS